MQKSGETVRVNVQLIKAATDAHFWADTFDRKLTDIFSVESEIAKTIADQLRAKLTGQEEKAISDKPTNNPEAYDAYLRGLAVGVAIGVGAGMKMLTGDSKSSASHTQGERFQETCHCCWGSGRNSLSLLFNNRDPYTGEVLVDDCSCCDGKGWVWVRR